MKMMRRALNALAIGIGLLVSFGAAAGLIVNAPIDVIGNLSAAQFTSLGYGTNTYKDWGNEPSVAVNPLNPDEIVVSSFAYNASATTGANIFYSTNGGASWTSQFSVPRPAAGVGIPNDWTFSYDNTGVLHAAVLGGCDSACNIYHGTTTNPTSQAAWTWTGGGTPINTALSINNADQPWLAVQGSTVFVAYDDFHTGTGERVAVSQNNGTTFTIDHPINNGAQSSSVNPGTRIATDDLGNVYSIMGVGTTNSPDGVHHVDYYLNRSRDNGNTWDFNGSSAIGGILLGGGTSQQLNNAGTQASNRWFAGVNDLRGNVTAVAANSDGSRVYALIGHQDASGIDRIYLVALRAVGANLVASPEVVVSVPGQRAAFPSITVLDNGTIVIMYDAYDSGANRVDVHIATSTDFGASFDSDIIAYSFVPLTLAATTGSTTSNREFGDFQYLTSIGDTFYGAFAGLGDVNGGGINTTALIDPFFISGTVPEPATLVLMLGALLGFGFLRPRVR
jgi:hypothetical protein